MKIKNNGPLTMRQACKLIGWTDESGKVSVEQLRRLRRKLKTAERTGDKRYVFGGGQLGADCWTTPRALYQLQLLPEDPEFYADAKDAIALLHTRLDEMNARLELLAEALFDNRRDIISLQKRSQ